MKLNLIYNSEIRNSGTPVHFWAAMRNMKLDFERSLPMGNLPMESDFRIWIDDGRDDLRWLPPYPWGYYATDTHLGWDYRRWKAGHADVVWCAQKPAADRMRAEGLNAHWLPLGCNPMAHPLPIELKLKFQEAELPFVKYDIGFVGFLQKPEESNRIEFLDAMFKAFPNFLTAFGVFHEDMARVYHQCRIGLNHAIRDDLNMRFFELASVGVPQLCDRRMVGLADLGFQENAHYLGYSSTEEAIEVARHWLGEPDKLAAMARAAHYTVRANHTYEHRVHRMLGDINDFLATSVRSEAATRRDSLELLV